ncbi:hypothetical protein CKO38_06185 [Rhodospirillum rubrum]|uniref:DUF3035 domain-containing protein n=1 Tax=Rhodospirillum rubrum TaxID=1085 RepID=UPI00190388E4|nr:DUF3035 domain-containing protein [Rhodospirillum rubrum]MBK1664476.1 hypothetical protein [Rhodospirillum rubrum]MBK1676267.1 hypothetical protein [Rhodospirillum rubrum]
MNPFARTLVAAALLAPLALSGCTNAKKSLGLDRQPPDEFKVVTRAPLAMPPDFNLRPPQPGIARPQEVTPRDSARAALTGVETPMVAGGLSSGEQVLLAKAGADRAIPDIRTVVNRETSALSAEERTFTDRLVFWRAPEEDPGNVVDPEAENRRLRENQSLGKPVTDGRTPTIERRQKGILEGIF